MSEPVSRFPNAAVFDLVIGLSKLALNPEWFGIIYLTRKIHSDFLMEKKYEIGVWNYPKRVIITIIINLYLRV